MKKLLLIATIAVCNAQQFSDSPQLNNCISSRTEIQNKIVGKNTEKSNPINSVNYNKQDSISYNKQIPINIKVEKSNLNNTAIKDINILKNNNNFINSSDTNQLHKTNITNNINLSNSNQVKLNNGIPRQGQRITSSFLINQIITFYDALTKTVYDGLKLKRNKDPAKQKAVNSILQIITLFSKLEISGVRDIRCDRFVVAKQLLNHLKILKVLVSEIYDMLAIDMSRFIKWIDTLISNVENWLSYQ